MFRQYLAIDKKTMFSVALTCVALTTVTAAHAMKDKPEVDCASFTSACSTQLTDLCATIEEADSLKDRDRLGMMGKTAGADTKINQAKYADAAQKLTDLDNKLYQLENARKAKIAPFDADAIGTALVPAQACVDQL
ncbi:MAG: hypothetical protein OEQ39_16335 [Gammaproteobacteria bacterium]|nr:hypothetical protein [Gammaproteobacteria bacterium]